MHEYCLINLELIADESDVRDLMNKLIQGDAKTLCSIRSLLVSYEPGEDAKVVEFFVQIIDVGICSVLVSLKYYCYFLLTGCPQKRTKDYEL